MITVDVSHNFVQLWFCDERLERMAIPCHCGLAAKIKFKCQDQKKANKYNTTNYIQLLYKICSRFQQSWSQGTCKMQDLRKGLQITKKMSTRDEWQTCHQPSNELQVQKVVVKHSGNKCPRTLLKPAEVTNTL